MTERISLAAVFGALALILNGCADGLPPIRLQVGSGEPLAPPRFLGLAAAGEPEAVLVAKDVLTADGNAADAATALGLALAVTLPSRAGLAAHGACLVRDGKSHTVDALRLGRLADGMYALRARYGTRAWAQVVAPAAQLARFGTQVSRALSQDIARYGSPLVDDRATFVQFTTPARQLLATGDVLKQPQLAATLDVLRLRGVTAGKAEWIEPRKQQLAGADVYALPPARDGATDAELVATSFAVADANGMAVVCVVSMGHAFGQGRLSDAGDFTPTDDGAAASAAIVMNGNTGEIRAGVAGEGDLVSHFAMLTAKGGKLSALKDVLTTARDTAPATGWMCAVGVQTDGRACESFARPAGSGYALVLEPDDR